ncbi:MAG: tetratricopeptide repeat protein [Bacteroidales bacterium]|nr:tetratricopeptide repeat protein [Bacteroidales bacterium]
MKTTAKLLLTMMLLPLAVNSKAQEASPLPEAREAMARYEYSRAIELLDKALESAKEASEIRDLSLQKARCLKRMLHYDAAAETLASVMTPGALDVEVAGELADCHVSSGRLADALGLYSILGMQHPDNLYFSIQKASLLFKVNDFQGCAEEGRAICARDSIPSVLSLVGASLLKMGQVDSSLTYYRKSLRLNPSNPNTVVSISNILLGKKDYDSTVSLTKDFLERNPDNLGVVQILGVAYYLKDDQDAAYEVFKQLRKDGDDSYGTMYYSGLNALALNRFEVAQDCFESAWETDSSDVRLAVNYGVSLARDIQLRRKNGVMINNTDRAIRLFGKAEEMAEPDHELMYKIHNGLGQLYFMRQDTKAALPHYLAAYEHNPKDNALLVSIGYCHRLNKDYKTALRYYEKYLSVSKEGTKNHNFAKEEVNFIKSELHMLE